MLTKVTEDLLEVQVGQGQLAINLVKSTLMFWIIQYALTILMYKIRYNALAYYILH